MDSFKQTLYIAKEALKFSAAHMTVFPDGTKERLHGHNYTTEITIRLKSAPLSKMVAFSVFKEALKAVCDAWDEKVLLAAQCPAFKIVQKNAEEIDFQLCQKRYVLPMSDVELLPFDNVTCENLSGEFLKRVLALLKTSPAFAELLSLQIQINESPAQGASSLWEREE